MVEENFLNENVEYSDEKNEEDPLLVAQRYLNIFHQIHIFNESKQEEFDLALMDIPTRIRESIASIPGGRVLLEYIQDLEKKHGRTSEKIANFPSKGNKIASTPSNGGNIAPVGISGNLSLGPEFAENLATSLATALKNNNIGGNSGNSNMEELSKILSQSFKSYASNMQQFTQALIAQTRQSANLIQQTQNQTIAQQANSAPLNTQNQQNLQTNNSNSTTINNVNMDTSFIDRLANVLVNNDNQRHEDFMQLLQVLKHQKSSAPITVMNPTTNNPVISDTSYVEEAIRENNAMQLQAIKSFGEMIVEAITQSQKELAQTIAQSTPRHTVKVVVSQDVDVEDQTNGASFIKQENNNDKNNSKNNNKKEENSKDKNSFIKNISNKLSETTNKLSAPKNITNKPTENFLDKINKGLNSFKEEIKKQPIISHQENNNSSIKEQSKENKPIINEKKQNNNQTKQVNNSSKTENKNQSFDEKTSNNIHKPFVEKDIDDILSTDISKNSKSIDFKPKNKDTNFDDLLLDELLDIKNDNPIIPNTNIPEKKEITQNSPVISTPKPQSTTNQAQSNTQATTNQGQPKPQTTINQPQSNTQLTANQGQNQPKPQPTINQPQNNTLLTANQAINQSQTKPQPVNPQIATPTRTATPPQYKATTGSYVDALEKIKDALSSDVSKVMNEDIKPISLNEIDDITTTNKITTSSNDQISNNDDEWEYVEETEVNGDDEWEYVEETDDEEWEYVDEDGNPVGNDDSEWEYVDENGNPVGNDDSEWEYIDENGNPVGNDDEWEYVEDIEDKKTKQ